MHVHQSRETKYRPSQYERSACNGLGTTGNVCPEILLPCAVLNSSRSLLMSEGCSVAPLHGLGFNPSILPIDISMLPSLPVARPPAYLVADRYQRHNKKVACRNPNVDEMRARDPGSTRVSLLDQHMRVLGRSLVRSEGCLSGRHRIVDGRLIALPESRTIYLAYANYWGSCDNFTKGYFLSPLQLRRSHKHDPHSMELSTPQMQRV